MRGLSDASRALQSFDDKEATAKLTLDGAKTFTTKLQNAYRSLVTVDGKRAEVGISANVQLFTAQEFPTVVQWCMALFPRIPKPTPCTGRFVHYAAPATGSGSASESRSSRARSSVAGE
jgi:hypothetical protein